MSKWGRKGLDTIEVNCTVDIEQTFESLHAYVELDGVEAGPGDVVIVHDAPIDVAFGERVICWRRATVQRATWYSRLQAHIEGYLALIELFEVGFSAGRTS
jgi:hypothetical protein